MSFLDWSPAAGEWLAADGLAAGYRALHHDHNGAYTAPQQFRAAGNGFSLESAPCEAQ
jgi:hypothetical protein